MPQEKFEMNKFEKKSFLIFELIFFEFEKDLSIPLEGNGKN
jgi:hypothetical protein